MTRIFTVAVALLIAAGTPVAVWAQSSGDAPQPASERRPFRGIFSGLSDRSAPHSLVLSGSLFGAYDDNVLAGLGERNARDWRLQQSGTYAGAYAGLDYGFSRVGRRLSVAAQAGGQLRYYRSADFSTTSPDYQAGANLRYAISRSTTLSGGHQMTYSRDYRLLGVAVGGEGIIDPEPVLGDPNLGLFQLAALRNSTQVTLSQGIGRYAALSAGYAVRWVDFLHDEDRDLEGDEPSGFRLRDYRTQSVSGRFHYARPFTAHATLNLGYGIRVSDSQSHTGEPRTMHDISAGVGYSRALSFSRRTSVSFSTGSAIAVTDELSEPESESRTHVRLIGNVGLVHELGRTWTARLSYYRGFIFQEGFDEPFFTDGATVGIGGLITRRLSFSAGGAWVLSTLDRPGQSGQTGFTGSAQSTYALSRYLALFAQYVYSRYDFGTDVPLDPRFPRLLDRQGVRAGISTSVPLLR